jgi:hypothetical protein
MIPIIALLEKRIASNKPKESNSFRGWFRKSFRNPIITELFFSPGTMSLISEKISMINRSDMGRKGMSVKMKIRVGGIAMKILNEIAAALSNRFAFRSC